MLLTRNYLDLLRLILGLLSLFCQSYMIHKKIVSDWLEDRATIKFWSGTKLAKFFCGTDYKKEQVGSVAWELETKTKLTFFFRTLIAHYNPKDFLVDRPVLSIYMFLKEVFEKSIQVRYLRKHRFTQTQSHVKFDVYDFCICSSNHVDIFPPLIYKKMHTHPTKTLLLLDESTQSTNFADRAIKVW